MTLFYNVVGNVPVFFWVMMSVFRHISSNFKAEDDTVGGVSG